MENLDKIIVVEFSVKQQAFHKCTGIDLLKNNIQNIFMGKETDYLPIGVFNTQDEADRFISAVYTKFKKSESDLQQDAAIKYFKQ